MTAAADTGDGATGDVAGTIPLHGTEPWLTLWPLCWWGSDPTLARTRTSFARAAHTPDGPGTLELRWRPGADTAEARTWGPGGGWLLAGGADLLGAFDHAHAATFDHRGNERLRQLSLRHAGLRICRSGLVWPHLLFTILGQRVTVEDAGWAWNALVRRLGDEAPGPLELRLPPSPDRVATMGYAELHPFNVDRSRAETTIRCARELASHPSADVDAQLARVIRLPGVGPWTATTVRALALGDPDAVPSGDLHLPSTVAWALAGEPRAADARMFELLAPYAGHRWRVVRLLFAGGVSAPRRGPRQRIRPISRR